MCIQYFASLRGLTNAYMYAIYKIDDLLVIVDYLKECLITDAVGNYGNDLMV